MEKIIKKIAISGKITVVSGLHIGGTDNALEIGGVKNPVIRIERDNKRRPYLPGSSLKGKMRSLIEHLRQDFSKDKSGNLIPGQEEDFPTARIFGTAAGGDGGEENETGFQRPSRIIFRDAYLVEQENQPDPTEVKTENSISRVTATANPRPLERVLPGTEFEMEIVLNIFDGDLKPLEDKKKKMDKFKTDAERILGYVFIGMDLVESDFLGGGGSRGNGKVAFSVEGIKIKSAEDYHQFKPWTTVSSPNLRPKNQKEFDDLAKIVFPVIKAG